MGVLFARAPYPVPVVKPRGRLVLVGRGLGFYPIPSADPGLSVCAVAEVRAAARTALTAASAIPVTHRASALLRLRVSDFAPEALSALGGWSPRKKEPKKRRVKGARRGALLPLYASEHNTWSTWSAISSRTKCGIVLFTPPLSIL